MRTLILSMLVVAGCANNDSSCITNRDCAGGTCVNGTCASNRDAGSADATDACVPWTCETLGQICRDADDGCGGRLSCGAPGTVTHGPFDSTATATAEWRFSGRARMLRQTVCFDEVPSEANGFGEGMYVEFLTGNFDAVGFHYGIRDRTFDLGDAPGVIFSKYGDDNDPAHIRLGPNSVMADIAVPNVPVGIRMPLTLSVGCYEASLEVTESSAGGDWVEFSITHSGSEMNVGALWFARENPSTAVSLSSIGSTRTIFFGADNRPSNAMPRYDFRVRSAADELALQSIRASYATNTATNTSCEYLPSIHEMRFLVGGDTFRCMPGVLDGDFYLHTWSFEGR